MHHVNDDMDELFRRAGKEYPLDTGGADWEKIAGELNIPAEEKGGSGNSNKKFLWLLLLLPFSFICTQYFADKGNGNDFEAKPKSTAVKPVPQNEPKGSGSTVNGTQKTDQYKPQNTDLASKEFNQGTDEVISAAPVVGTNVKSARKDRKDVWSSDQPALDAGNVNFTYTSDNAFSERSFQQFLSSLTYPYLLISPAVAAPQNIVAFPSPESKRQKEEKSKRFYAGLIGGVDATTIKFQKIENAGYDLGVLLGYSFNKKWSIEAGILRDKKFYYSTGEYFNSSKIYIPPDTKITSIDGNCSMWELPLSVRYNIKSSVKHSWFVTGGLSSYLMKKENYSYGYYYYSTGQTHYYDHSYESSSKTIFSVVQVTGGYTHRLGKIGDLRIEPYIKIPVRGVGIGSMPFQSAGIHIGLTREIF